MNTAGLVRIARVNPPPLRTADGHNLERRRASWVELFFDLVVAAAVNQLAGTLQDHPDLSTLARFAFIFVPVWWLWVQFSFYADRHESDDATHRCLFLIAIVGCAGLAASASRAILGHPAGFVIAFGALRGLLLLLYARARRALPATRSCTAVTWSASASAGRCGCPRWPPLARRVTPSGRPRWPPTPPAPWGCSSPGGTSRSTPGTWPSASSSSS